MPNGKKRKRHKMATHKRKKRLRKNRHKKKQNTFYQYQSGDTFYLFWRCIPVCHFILKYELLVDSRPNEVVIALLRDKQLLELHKEPVGTKFSVGDIFLAKVKKIITGLNATFVDVGYEKDGFLHYLDLGVKFKTFQKFTERNIGGKLNTASLRNFKHEPEIDKSGSINDVLKSGNQILVQVAKEPISTKGPRLTTEVTIAGRYMVLVPFSNKVSVSQ